jgi:diguanylate cyclase (GGDEF)-like protein
VNPVKRAWCLALGLLLGGASCSATAEVPLHAQWQAGAQPQAGRWQTFDPTRLKALPRNPEGAWVRLVPAGGSWPQAPLVAVVRTPPLGPMLLQPPTGPPQPAALDDLDPSHWHGHGRLAFALLQALPPDAPLLLQLPPYPSTSGPVTFAVQSLAEYAAEDARWLTFASICFTTMVAMAAVALLFAVRLSEASFWHYCGYVLSYALVLSIQTGFMFQPLHAAWVAQAPLLWGRAGVGLSVMFATLFLDSFAGLHRYAPRLRRVVLAVGWATGAVTLLGLVPSAASRDLARALINPLLMLGAPLLLTVSSIALLRGSRYAGFFLVGWTPLLAATVLGSAQIYGALAGWTWVSDAALAAGAFESLTLSLGLADRMLAVRRERDHARALAELDSLTGLLNRRAWTASLERIAAAGAVTGQPATVMFIDLDHFKQLNDSRGHEAGDRALVAVAGCLNEELRPGDVIGRYGGEEFVVALPRCGEARALNVAERLRAGIQALGVPLDQGTLTASIGVAILKPGEGIKGVLTRADAAMYQAKAQGRNCVVLDPAASPRDGAAGQQAEAGAA